MAEFEFASVRAKLEPRFFQSNSCEEVDIIADIAGRLTVASRSSEPVRLHDRYILPKKLTVSMWLLC